MPDKKYDIYDRAFGFAVRVVKFLDKLPKNTVLIEYSRQLIRASGSIGANLEEADGALTRKDFLNKIGIARRESREAKHWLRLIESVIIIKDSVDQKELKWLINESTEILLILSSIIRNTEKNN
jgi:four helix bundle protein